VDDRVAGINEEAHSDTLIHMAGYADVGYSDPESSDGSFNVGSFSPIFHFQYRDLVMLESELEIELGDDGETETNLEYLTIDWFINDYMALVAGKFLSPIGQFRQNLHASWINKLPTAPPIAAFEDGGYELEGVEAEGFGADADGEKVVGGRFGFIPFSEFEIGISAANGKATVASIEDGDSSLLIGEGARDYEVLGADFSWSLRTLNLRGEYVETKVGADTGSGTAASPGATWETWYTQGTWRPGQNQWELVARYTDFDSPHDNQDQQQWAFGVNYLFASNFIGKIAYEFNDGESNSDADLNRLLLQMAYGF
jgi:hypothetical protein